MSNCKKRDPLFYCMFMAMVLCTQCMLAVAQTSPKIVWLDYRQSEAIPGAVIKYSEEITGTTGPLQVKLFTHPEHVLVCTYYYTDTVSKIKEGPYLKYYANGALSDSGYFRSNRKYGLYKEWYDNWNPKSILHYSFDVLVDTCTSWYQNGNLSMQMICDENGNGMRTDYYQSGAIKGVGKIRNGQQHQRWNYFHENGKPLMDVSFYEGDALNTTCYNENGNEYKNDCSFSNQPMFAGGNAAWTQFINEHLTYPPLAKQKGIEGIVRVYFDIDALGNLGNFDVVFSPDPMLSNEVIRLLKSSPAWKPAAQLNQPVGFRMYQDIFFKAHD